MSKTNKILVLVIAVIAVVLILFGMLSFLHEIPSSTPSSNALSTAYYALTATLGKSYKVTLNMGPDANASLLVGNLNNHQFYVDYSNLYYIEQGNYIIAYPPGSKEYWGNLSYNLGVLQLTHVTKGPGAIMSNTDRLYYTGGNYTVLLIGTYSRAPGFGGLSDGYSVALFFTPPRPPINGSINYTQLAINVGMMNWPFHNSGGIYYPYSTTPYIVVQWEPLWNCYRDSWTTGEFNVWVVHPSPNGTVYVNNITLLVGGGGNGFIQNISPGDLIEMMVTYDGYDNTIYATVTNLNTSSTIDLTLPLYSNFTVPRNGYYWIEVNANPGFDGSNWAIVYLSVFNNVYVQIEKA